MSSYVLVTDTVALLAMLAGFHIAFRQRLVRGWWQRLHGRPPETHVPDDDPAHYAMIISGMMLLAFGLMIACFITLFGLFTAGTATLKQDARVAAPARRRSRRAPRP